MASKVSVTPRKLSRLTSSRVDRFKTSLQFILLPYGSFFSALDALKVADYTLLLLSSQVEVNGWGDTLLRAMQAQGFPSVVTAVSPSTTSMQINSQKDQAGAIKSLLSFIQYFIPSQGRVFDLESTSNSSDAVNLVRALCEGKPTDVRWREDRPYMLVEESEWVPNSDAGESSLRLTGVIRGAPMSANRLVHLPELGDFKLSKVRHFC
jgi:pre-rRNA-processing protein TSR1